LYNLCDEVLQEVHHAKYLGVTISDDLKWCNHVDNISKKSSNTLNFLRRNLKYCPRNSKETAFFALVRSTVEYSCTIWDPYLKKDVDNLEKIHRRAARFVMNDYKLHSSVTVMLNKLKWPSLEHRRKNQRLTTMFKIVQGLVAVPSSHLISADSRTRANHVYKFKNISASSTVYMNSFFPRTIPQWNSLDKDIAEAPSLSCFKNRLP